MNSFSVYWFMHIVRINLGSSCHSKQWEILWVPANIITTCQLIVTLLGKIVTPRYSVWNHSPQGPSQPNISLPKWSPWRQWQETFTETEEYLFPVLKLRDSLLLGKAPFFLLHTLQNISDCLKMDPVQSYICWQLRITHHPLILIA